MSNNDLRKELDAFKEETRQTTEDILSLLKQSINLNPRVKETAQIIERDTGFHERELKKETYTLFLEKQMASLEAKVQNLENKLNEQKEAVYVNFDPINKHIRDVVEQEGQITTGGLVKKLNGIDEITKTVKGEKRVIKRENVCNRLKKLEQAGYIHRPQRGIIVAVKHDSVGV